jgi:nucleoside deoxyribosyltransferase
MKHSVFLSGSWFSLPEELMLADMKTALHQNEKVGDIYWCLDNQHGEIDVTDHPEVADSLEWKVVTYDTDIAGLHSQDIVVVMMVPGHEDAGASNEIGYAKAIGKPIVLVLRDQDYTLDSNHVKDSKLNLMVGMGVDVVIPLSQLSTYDFDHIRHQPYLGKCY